MSCCPSRNTSDLKKLVAIANEINEIENKIKEYIPKYLNMEHDKIGILEYIRYVDKKDMLSYEIKSLRNVLIHKKQEHELLLKSIIEYNGW